MSLAILWQVTDKEEVDMVHKIADNLESFFLCFHMDLCPLH